MKKIKILTAMILAVLTCFVSVFVVGCGNNNKIDINTTGELKKDENGNVIFEDVTIKLATVVAGTDVYVFNDIIKRFNLEYDGKIQVVAESTAQGLFEKTIGQNISQNNNSPDFIMSHEKHHKNFLSKGLIQPIDDVMETSGIKINFDNYAQGLAKYRTLGSSDGKTYSVPADAQSMVVVYNKKLLNEIGCSVPTNRAELLDVCSKFKAKYSDKYPIAWIDNELKENFYEYSFASAVLQNGGTLINAEGRADWYDNETNRAAFTNAIKAYREIYDNGYAKRNTAKATALESFNTGNCLFYVTSPWDIRNIIGQVAKDKKISENEVMDEYVGGTSISGWFAMGDNASKPYADYIYGDSHFFAMVSRVSDINKKAAILEFIKWFNESGKASKQWAKAGHITAYTGVSAQDDYVNDKFISTYISKFYPDMNDFMCLPMTNVASEVVSNMVSLCAKTIVLASGYTDKTDGQAIKSTQDAVNTATDFFTK